MGRRERAAGHGESGGSVQAGVVGEAGGGERVAAVGTGGPRLCQGGGAPVAREEPGKDGGCGHQRNRDCGKEGESCSPGGLGAAGPGSVKIVDPGEMRFGACC